MNRIFECQVPAFLVQDRLSPGSQFSRDGRAQVPTEGRDMPLPVAGHLLKPSHGSDSEVGGGRGPGSESKDKFFA